MDLQVRHGDGGHRLHGGGGDVDLVNRYLAHLAARGFSPASVRAYAFDILNFLRFCAQRGLGLKATRYYSHGGVTVGVRTAVGLNWLVADHHGTAEVSINATTLAVAKRRTLPYGEQRGTTSGGWPAGMDKGFVGGTNDPTGLTHLGAREYDPFIGRFISVDPLIDPNDPQALHGYTYSNNNSATQSDPTGLSPPLTQPVP